MEQIAISGSSGFIGSRLSERFQEPLRLDRSGFGLSCDVIFDLAAYGNMAGQTPEITETYNANLLRVMRTTLTMGNTTKLIYISTSSVKLPHQTFYSASKKACEDMLQIIARDYGLKIAIVRPYTIVGVGEQKEHLIPKLIDSCLKGTEMPFVPDPVHDFLDVQDFVDALLVIKDKAQFKGEIYEVGSGEQLSNDVVRQLVEQITGKKANIKPVENMRNYDTKEWRSNNERIYSLGWSPKKNLHQTISEEYAEQNTGNI